jgi:predicted ATP-grasp superfamily ATP-dependent carboligase
MMLRALIADLAALPGIQVSTTRNSRLPGLDLPASVSVVACDAACDSCFDDCVRTADAVWPVAPESSGILERLSLRILDGKRILLGSKPEAVRTASSKLRTARALATKGIAVVDTYGPDEKLPGNVSAWVVKPDDGVGCIDTRIFHGAERALAWIHAHGKERFVLQPFVQGRSCSLSLLCRDGAAQVLSCNEQRIAVRNNQFHYLGCTVNKYADHARASYSLAQKIARAIPGLWGYVGVDFIMTGDGPVVLEVNPRLTTSYAGLHASIGSNPAALVLGLLDDLDGVERPALMTVPVSVDAEVFGG